MLRSDEALRERQDDLLMYASAAYRADLQDLPVDAAMGDAPITPALGDMSERAVEVARNRENEIRVLGRYVAYAAWHVDAIESGGIKALFGRIELGIMRVMHPKFTKQILASGGLVEQVRVAEVD